MPLEQAICGKQRNLLLSTVSFIDSRKQFFFKPDLVKCSYGSEGL